MPGPQPPDLTVVQFSDTHLFADPARRLARTVDVAEQFDRAIVALVASEVDVAALVVTGDLADDGKVDTYRRARAILDDVCARLGDCPLLVLPGNHDARGPFRAGFLGETTGSEAPCTGMIEIDGLRIVGLDSVRPGAPDGALDDGQLDWLREVLATPARRGTIVAVHHPPIPGPVLPMNQMGLRSPERLGDVLRGSDVRMVVSGHVHHASAGMVAGVPVWTSPALAYTMDTLVSATAGSLRGLAPIGFTRIDVRGGDVVASAVQLEVGDPVLRWDS